MTWGLYYWPVWITVTGLMFLPVELFALFTNVNNTLSDYCWKELNVTRALTFDSHGFAWWLSFVFWIMFVIAITIHIWFKGVLWPATASTSAATRRAWA